MPSPVWSVTPNWGKALASACATNEAGKPRVEMSKPWLLSTVPKNQWVKLPRNSINRFERIVQVSLIVPVQAVLAAPPGSPFVPDCGNARLTGGVDATEEGR